MALTLADLLVAKTAEEIKALILADLASRGFPVTDWESGGAARTLVETFSKIFEDFSALILAVTKGGLLEESDDGWLTLLARSNFETTRQEATFALHDVTLSCASGSGPYTIVAGQLWAKDASGLLFNNVNGGDLLEDDTLVLSFKAEQAGTDYNVAEDAITILATPLPGVSITASEATELAVDEETDEELRERAALQWSTLAAGGTEATYKKFALDASANVKRVKVEEDIPVPGSVRITLASTDGTVSGDDVDDVEAYLEPRRPLTVALVVQAADEVSVDIEATVKIKAADQAAAAAVVEDNLRALLRTIEINDTLYKAEIVEVLMALTGAKNAVVSDPAADVELGDAEVVTLGTVDITWETF